MEDQSVQNPIQEPVVTPVPVLPSTKNNNFPVVVFAVLTLVLLGSTAFLYYQNQQLKNMLAGYQIQPTVSPTSIAYQSPVPSATPDPTANWKMFTSLMYGFSVKYPQDWLGNCKDIKGDWTSGSVCELRAPNTDPYNTTEFITISIEKPTPGRETLAEIVAFELKNFGNKLSPKSINGVDGYFYTNKDSSVFFTQKGNYFIVINWFPLPEDNKYKIIIDQILSTFKFTK